MKRPWYSGWQWRDLLPVIISIVVLVVFAYVVVRGSALVIVAVMHHIRHSLHHP